MGSRPKATLCLKLIFNFEFPLNKNQPENVSFTSDQAFLAKLA